MENLSHARAFASEDVERSEKAIRGLLAFLSVAFVFSVLLSIIRPAYLLSPVTTTGGDMGAHHYLPYYLKTYLLPRGRITGWSPGWYAGFPALTFYFPLPSLAIALLSYAIKYEIAFKLVSVAGVFALPVCAYVAMRAMGFTFPTPEFSTLTILPFLLMGSFTINGGNILSTLAGEFSFSIAFALMLPALAYAFKAADGRAPVRTWAALFALCGLCHLVPAAAASAAAFFSVPGRPFTARFIKLTLILALAFALSAFWLIPFLSNLEFSAGMVWTQAKHIKALFPSEFRMITLLALGGFIAALVSKDRRLVPVAALAATSLVAYFIVPAGAVWNGRFLPMWFVGLSLSAAYLMGRAAGAARRFFRRPLAGTLIPCLAIALSVLSPSLGSLQATRETAAAWAQWNYSGYEGKEGWPEYKEAIGLLRRLPPGRVMWEYSPDYGSFGTPRAFEMLPYWTDRPTMEGTLIESSLTAPFHFINQAEVSAAPTHAVSGIDYPPFNFARGLAHLRQFNVRYLMVYSPLAKAHALQSPGLKVRGTSGKFIVYELPTDGYVRIPDGIGVSKERSWRKTSLAWYARENTLDKPIVFTEDPAALRALADLVPDGSRAAEARQRPYDVKLANEEITFKTRAIGRPHIVAVSYFPRWKAEGALGPYLVTPSLMAVIPTQRDVRLYYGYTFSDYAGFFLTVAGIIVLLFPVTRRRRKAPLDRIPYIRYRKL
ncbi:MAG: 6-pyruvoyl-tetrahydropterin synthase-related protein [Candidatus Aquicultorales bacterium]